MSNGIDATVVLGLAGKAAGVFAEPGTYLSFPLGPVGIEAARLKALADDPMSHDGQQALAEFSLLVNEIPVGPLWQPDGDRFWDIYGDVLSSAELANEPPRTPEEEADYRTAHDLLYRTDEDGVVVDSPTVVAYQQRRDAYVAAVQEYNNRAGAAAVSTDPAVAAQWQADEPQLKAVVAEAEQDWAIAGHRAEVEDARRVLREFASRSPAAAWSDYRKLFDPELPEIYFRTSPDGSTYLPTGYLPSDVVDSAWPTMTATIDELKALGDAAPEELRSRLGSSTDADVTAVSFEYSSVTVSRPWLADEAFGSRAWRFYDTGRALSDGGSPPAGECTAYVTGLVLARNITVRRKSPEPKPTSLGFLPLAELVAAPLRLGARPYVEAQRLERASLRRSVLLDRPAPVVAEPLMARRRGRLGVLTAPTPDALVAEPVIRRAPIVERRPVTAERVIQRVSGLRRPLVLPPLEPAEPPSGESSTTTGANEVYVLAFVCRLLPKAPDPDPSLTWS